MISTQELDSFFAPNPSAPPPDALAAAARDYLNARRKKEVHEEALKNASLDAEKAKDVLIRKMEETGVKSLKVETPKGTFHLIGSVKRHYQLPHDYRDDPIFTAWLDAQGGADLVKVTINAHSFAAFCRELEARGEAVATAVKVVEEKNVSVRKD